MAAIDATAAVRPSGKDAIVAGCGAFVRDVLKPRFLLKIRPTERNYPIGMRGGGYRFIKQSRLLKASQAENIVDLLFGHGAGRCHTFVMPMFISGNISGLNAPGKTGESWL